MMPGVMNTKSIYCELDNAVPGCRGHEYKEYLLSAREHSAMMPGVMNTKSIYRELENIVP